MLVENAACAVAWGIHKCACETLRDLVMWSFNAMKILATGHGGILYVCDPELVWQARRLACHALKRRSGFSTARVSDRWWYLDVRNLGRRVLGEDLTAVLGSVQLRNLPVGPAQPHAAPPGRGQPAGTERLLDVPPPAVAPGAGLLRSAQGTTGDRLARWVNVAASASTKWCRVLTPSTWSRSCKRLWSDTDSRQVA